MAALFTIVGQPGDNTMSLIQTNLYFDTRRDAELYIYNNSGNTSLSDFTKRGIPIYYKVDEAKEKKSTSFTIIGRPGDIMTYL